MPSQSFGTVAEWLLGGFETGSPCCHAHTWGSSETFSAKANHVCAQLWESQHREVNSWDRHIRHVGHCWTYFCTNGTKWHHCIQCRCPGRSWVSPVLPRMTAQYPTYVACHELEHWVFGAKSLEKTWEFLSQSCSTWRIIWITNTPKELKHTWVRQHTESGAIPLGRWVSQRSSILHLHVRFQHAYGAVIGPLLRACAQTRFAKDVGVTIISST